MVLYRLDMNNYSPTYSYVELPPILRVSDFLYVSLFMATTYLLGYYIDQENPM